MKTESSSNINKKRKLSFYIILILLPFIILILLELLLRIGGFGSDVPLFIESQQFKNYYQPNPNIIQRYFPNPELAPNVSPDTEFFKKEKPLDSFRIIIQGGSTAAGFPYGRWGSIKGMLDQRFKRLYPNRNIEIINTAISAVNSYTLLDFVDEIIEQQPDLVLIYAGHNEYLGLMGVGSAFASRGGRAATLLYLKLKSLRLYQLLERIFYSGRIPTDEGVETRTLMSQIAREKNIPFDSEMYQLGKQQFSENLSLILQKYHQHNIPVMVSTLISNEKDQAPFSSINSSVNSTDWETYRLNSAQYPDSININQLKQQFESSNTAGDAYKVAVNYYTAGESVLAKSYFQKARDLDLLRFRAPTEFNQIINGVAEQYQVTVVDTERYFIANSDQGIPGHELVLEHLHPNAVGYFYLAEAFSDAIIEHNYLGQPKNNYPASKALHDIPISKSDQLFSSYKIAQLTSAYPFTKKQKAIPFPADNDTETDALRKRLKGESWLTIQQHLLIQYQQRKDFSEAAKIAALISDALPEQHQTSYIAGQLYFKVEDLQLAQYYHQRAVNISPQNIQYLLALAQDQYTNGALNPSLDTLTKVLKLDSKHKTAIFYRKKIEHQLSNNQ